MYLLVDFLIAINKSSQYELNIATGSPYILFAPLTVRIQKITLLARRDCSKASPCLSAAGEADGGIRLRLTHTSALTEHLPRKVQ